MLIEIAIILTIASTMVTAWNMRQTWLGIEIIYQRQEVIRKTLDIIDEQLESIDKKLKN
jgi:hypothetical protein